MNFKEALLSKQTNTPESIQKIIDSGLINQYECIDGIHYLLFSFRELKAKLYDYMDDNPYGFVPFTLESVADIIYCGGMAVDDKGEILKGVIYPYYTNLKDANIIDNTFKGYAQGTPQLLCKNDNLKIGDIFFRNKDIRVYNIVTNNSNDWAKFYRNEEDYGTTKCYVTDSETMKGCDIYDGDGYFGDQYVWSTGEYVGVKKYTHRLSRKHAITIDYAKTLLKDLEMEAKIARKISCVNKVTDSIKGVGKDIKEAGQEIAQGTIHAGGIIGGNIGYMAYTLNKRLK